MAVPEERSTRDDVAAVVRAILARSRDAAGAGIEVVGAGVDDAVRALVDRRVQRALRSAAPAPTAVDVALALSDDGSSATAARLGSAGTWLASRTRLARSVGARTPLGLALALGPGLYEAVRTSIHGLDTAAAHLVGKARQHRVEPDPDRLRAVLVQALAGQPVDPDAEPDHAGLARAWLAEAGRRMAPTGLRRISGLTRGRTPDAVAAALAAVEVTQLGSR